MTTRLVSKRRAGHRRVAAVLLPLALLSRPAVAGADTTPTSAVAAYDRVVLKGDGTVIVGKIVTVDATSVTIQTTNGRLLKFRLIDVDHIETPPPPADVSPDAPDDDADSNGGDDADAAGDGKPKKYGETKTETTHRNHGYGLEVAGELKEAEAKRQAWKKRGGALFGGDVQLNATFTYLKSPATSGCSGGGGISGYGGGAALHGTLYFLKAPNPDPDPEKHSSTLFMFQLGSGAEFSALGTTTPAQTCSYGEYSTSVPSQTSGSGNLTIPFSAGLSIGLGGFGTGDSWSGLVLGLNYAPSYVLPFSFSSSSGSGGSSGPQGSFNAVGFNINFDITSLDALVDKAAQQAHFRFSVFALPPVASLPLLVTLGFGAVWY